MRNLVMSNGMRVVRRKIFAIALLFFILTTGLVKAEISSLNYVPGEVLVKFKPSISVGAISSMGFHVMKTLPSINVQKVAVPAGKSISEFIAELKANNNVIYAEPNYKIYQFSTTPNDPSFNLQWGLPMIHAPDAWDITKGDATVIVAVIDSGIDTTHPDLKNKISGGWNFFDGNSNYSDVNGHGTHVSGIIAAETNNGIGIAGTSWLSKILMLRIMNASGESDTALLSEAIAYAADNGAKIINMSLGGSNLSQTVSEEVDYAYNKGCVLIASSGNSGNDVAVSYPAALPHVLAVTAVDSSKVITSYSNLGPEIAVCAPGGSMSSTHDPNGILSTLPTYTVPENTSQGKNLNYDYLSGTSMAAPFVSGLAALLYAKFPTITRDQVIYAITSEAEDLGTLGKDNSYGFGLINLAASLGDIISPEVTIIVPNGSERLLKNEQFIIKWSASDAGGGLSLAPISLFFSSDNGTIYSQIVSGIANTGSYTWTVPETPTTQGKIKIIATDSAGNITTIESAAFTILNLINGIYLYPNPIKSGDTATFLGLAGDETIRIYDIAGDLVNSISNTNTWNTLDSQNQKLPDGVYLYVVTSSAGILKSGKMIITR